MKGAWALGAGRVGVSGRLNNGHPPHVPVGIPITCECFLPWQKRDFADGIKLRS